MPCGLSRADLSRAGAPEGPRTCFAVVSSTPPRLMRLFELSGVTGISPAWVADMISLPSRAPRPKCTSAPTCEVPANASCPNSATPQA